MFEYQDYYDEISDYQDEMAIAYNCVYDEEEEDEEDFGDDVCKCGRCCYCLGISERDFI